MDGSVVEGGRYQCGGLLHHHIISGVVNALHTDTHPQGVGRGSGEIAMGFH